MIYAAVASVLAFCIAAFHFEYISLFYSNFINSHTYSEIPVFEQSSSVWCHVSNGTRICTFNNVCYLPDKNQFLFTLTENSVVFGLSSKEDLKLIQLSSVLNHNLMSMNIVLLRPESKFPENYFLIDKPVFILWRFKWDNIMHVFHDDLIPLFLTYLDLCGNIEACASKYTLGFVDQGEAGPYEELYKLFSKHQPFFLHKYNTPLCIREIQAGILSTSIWFQYGFGRKQGPVKTSLPASIFHQFTQYIIQRLEICKKDIKNDTVLFFNRKLNRRILNLENFTSIIHKTVQEKYPLSQPTIKEVDIATHNISSILSVLLSSKIVVGIHGSAMILCIFLLPGSVIVELFPFGIQPEYVSFIKAFSHILGSGIIYKSWVNKNESLSIAHPNAPPLLGGIVHLPPSNQDVIRNTKLVPAVECCHNPMYLYRMFQDTVVGKDFRSAFQEVLMEQTVFLQKSGQTAYLNNLVTFWYFPAPVTNITCSFYDQIFTAAWQPPINAFGTLLYDVAVLFDNSSSVMRRIPQCHMDMYLNNKTLSLDIWIKAISPYGESSDSYSSCNLYK